jgi:hypothetical protein
LLAGITVSQGLREVGNPLPHKATALLQFGIRGSPAATHIFAAVPTLLKRFDIRKHPETLPIVFADAECLARRLLIAVVRDYGVANFIEVY